MQNLIKTISFAAEADVFDILSSRNLRKIVITFSYNCEKINICRLYCMQEPGGNGGVVATPPPPLNFKLNNQGGGGLILRDFFYLITNVIMYRLFL